MFLEPRDVGRSEKPEFAQEGYLCYESSYQPAHFAIVAILHDFLSSKQNLKRE
jgi:hypothetical protein